MSLKEYNRKRKFEQTPEPKAKKTPSQSKGPLTFVIQKHFASRIHYDFRLEVGGALVSWAVPKGPTLTSGDPRLAVKVEDHPIDYGAFEGTIPKGNYGAGTVLIWDYGTYVERGSQSRKDSEKALQEGLAKGHITFILRGKKLNGEFALIRIKKKGAPDNGWLLVKKHDEFASRKDILKEELSAKTGRSMKEIAAQAEKKGEIWIPRKGLKSKLPIEKNIKKSSQMPRRIRPMEALGASKVPSGAEWIYESYFTGVRAIAAIEDTNVHLYSRNFLPVEKKYPEIVHALKVLKTKMILDGEIITDGKTHQYVVHDLLYYKGKDLREVSLIQRKKQLDKISFKTPLQLGEWSPEMAKLKAASQVIAKKSKSFYVSGFSREWVRLPLVKRTSSPLSISDRPPLTHPDKIYFPEDKLTKRDIFNYYDSISDWILPHLIDKPQSLHRQPDGIRNIGFFHKDMNSFLPRRIQTVRVASESAGKTVNYICCQDKWTLLYLANLGCIELNPWLSRRQHLNRPDYLVIDLDPDGNSFKEVMNVAKEVYKTLKKVGIKSYCKTSGASGLHICVPTAAKYEYEQVREFAEAVCRIVQKKFPTLTSVERTPAKRRGKIYLDFLQNRRGQTLAAPYCLRPHPKAPVSTPLKWSELKLSLLPTDFTIENIQKRLKRVGDLWKPLLNSSENVEVGMKRLSKLFHI